jgi:hypothetical protein
MHPTALAILAVEHQRALRAEAEQSRRARAGSPPASTSWTLEGLLLGLRLPGRSARTPGPGTARPGPVAQPEPR